VSLCPEPGADRAAITIAVCRCFMVAASPAPSIIQAAQLSLNITIYDTRHATCCKTSTTAGLSTFGARLQIRCNAWCAGRWVPGSARVAVVGASAGGKGCLQVLRFEGSSLTPVADVRKPAPLKCGTFGAAGDVLPYALTLPLMLCTAAQCWRRAAWALARTQLQHRGYRSVHICSSAWATLCDRRLRWTAADVGPRVPRAAGL